MLHLLQNTDNNKTIIKDEDINIANKERDEDINNNNINIDLENMFCILDFLNIDNEHEISTEDLEKVYQRIGVDKLYNVVNQIEMLEIKYPLYISDYQENQKFFCLKLSEEKWIEEEFKEIGQALYRIERNKCIKALEDEVLFEWLQFQKNDVVDLEDVEDIKRRLCNILQIPVPDEYKWKPYSPSKTLKEIIMECNLTMESINNLRDSYIVFDDLYNMGIGTYGRMIDSLWQHIKNSHNKESSCKVLADYLEFDCDIEIIVNILPML